MLVSLPMTILKTCTNVALYNLRGSACFRVNLMVLVNLTTGGTVLVIRFTGSRISGKHSVMRSTLRTTDLHFHPVLVASLTFVLNVLPVIVTANPKSTDQRTVNANMFFKVVMTIAMNVLLIPFFFMVVCGTARGVGTGRWALRV